MKKSLVALAVLGGLSGMAAAQSAVTLFGVVDVNTRYVKNDGAGARKSLSNGGMATSRLGFRGVEDLGGGLKASFWVEGTMTPDDGTPTGQSWTRRSTLSLQGAFGEARLGRDYTPSFINYAVFDPFGVNGVGNLANIARYVAPNGPNTAAQITFIRSSNSIGYFLPPNMGGIFGQAMIAAGEGAAGKYVGGRVGYAGGPFTVAAAYGRQDTNVAGTTQYTTTSLGASWKVGPATLMAQVNQQTNDVLSAASQKERLSLLGAAVTVGQGEIRVSLARSDASGGATGFSAADASQVALGYVHNLSKRTALYATGSRIANKGSQAFSTATGSASPGGPTAGGKSTGLEGGIRHVF